MQTVIEEQPRVAAKTKATNGNRLSPAEKAELVKLEKVIHHHFETFRAAGNALTLIRDKRLYRETHPTFEAYCREKWATSKTQANRLIAAAKVVENVTRIVGKPTAEGLTESVVRPLTGLDAKQQQKVMRKVVETAPPYGGGITAKLVTDVARATVPEAFTRARPDGKETTTTKGRTSTSDFVRKTELLEEIAAWRKSLGEKFASMKPDTILNGVRAIIRKME